MLTRRFVSGFALLEVMIATILLCGLIYLFISFAQNQQRQVNTQNTGKQLAVVINSVLAQTSTGACASGLREPVPLMDCIPNTLSADFVTLLQKQGLDPTTATVTVG